MLNIKTLLTAAALGTVALAGAANAAPRHDAPAHHDMVRHQAVRLHPVVMRERVFATLRLHHFVGFGDPYFFGGHYVVRSHDRFGRVVLVEVDPYTGAFLGVIRI